MRPAPPTPTAFGSGRSGGWSRAGITPLVPDSNPDLAPCRSPSPARLSPVPSQPMRRRTPPLAQTSAPPYPIRARPPEAARPILGRGGESRPSPRCGLTFALVSVRPRPTATFEPMESGGGGGAGAAQPMAAEEGVSSCGGRGGCSCRRRRCRVLVAAAARAARVEDGGQGVQPGPGRGGRGTGLLRAGAAPHRVHPDG